MSEPDVLIILSTLAGCTCLIWRSKRQFKRLNKLGIEQFSSYGQKIRATTLETLLLGGGYGLLGAAGLISIFEYAQPLLSVLFLLAFIWLIQATLMKARK